MPLNEGNELLNNGTNSKEVGSWKSTWSPHEPPRNMTTPIKKNTFKVPNELNLVKNVGDLTLMTGSNIIRYKGAVFLLKYGLTGSSMPNWSSLEGLLGQITSITEALAEWLCEDVPIMNSTVLSRKVAIRTQ